MKRITIFFIILITLTGFFLRFGRLDHDLWFDEAGQYWIAKGQNHYSLDFKDRGISQVLLNNRQSNLDPPLFSLILHLWSSINNSLIWLRLLPNLFGLFTLIYIYKTLKLLRLNPLLSILICLLAWVSFSFVDYAQELRAYSLGLLSATAMFYYLIMYLCSRRNITLLIKLIIFTIIGISTQYNLWLLLPVISSFIFINDYKNRNYLATIIFLIPVMLILGIIYYGQTRFQLGGLNAEYLNKYKLGFLTLPEILIQIIYLNFSFICYILGYSEYAHNLFYRLYDPPYSIIVGLICFIFGIFLIVNALEEVHKKNFHFRLSIVFYFLLLLEINILSLLKFFPIGPNRWNLFHGPLLLINLAILLHLLIKKYQLVKIPVFLLISLIIIISILGVYSHDREIIYVKQVIKNVPLGESSVYLFSYEVIPTFKYHYQSYGPNEVYYSLASSNSTDSILDLTKFLSSHPPSNLPKKNITIIASDVDLTLCDKIYSAINTYSVKHNKNIKISKFKNTYAFILSAGK